MTAPPRSTVTEPQTVGIVREITKATTVHITGMPYVALQPAAPLGGKKGDDIVEAIVRVGKPTGPERISAEIVDAKGAPRWETQPLL